MSSSTALHLVHVVCVERRCGRNGVQFSPPRPEQSDEFRGSRTSVGVSVPTAAEDVPIAPVWGPSNVVDGGRQPIVGRSTAAQCRRCVGSIVVGDDGEDDGMPVATVVRRRSTAQLPQRHSKRVDISRRRHQSATQ